MTDSAHAAAGEVQYMQRALALAAQGWGQTAPNPMVGAVVVAAGAGAGAGAGAVAGEGFHARYGDAHAEVVALEAAGRAARGATLYVTLEPCAHYGKTPPCVNAILAAGIARVVAAVRDPSAIARGGAAALRAAGVVVDLGLERERAIELNAPFFNAHASRRPWTTLKLAISADERIADPTGARRWVTGPEARREVHRLRANNDAIAVGIGTVLADDPSLTVRDAPPPRAPPRRVVFDRRLRIPLESALVRSASRSEVVVVGGPDAPPDRRARLEAAGLRVVTASSLATGLESLRALGVRSLFVEGGARLAGAMLGEDLVDRLVIFRSPVTLGDAALGAFQYAPPGFSDSLATARVIDAAAFGADRMTTFALHEVPCSPD